MRLFIGEKPSVSKAIAAELGVTARGDGFIQCGRDVVTWCFGHMLEQAEPDAYTPDSVPRGKEGRKLWRQDELPIIPQTWLLRPKADARKQLAVIGRLLSDASEVVHAGDPDREGQLLVDDVLAHFRVRLPVQRFWVSAQDPISIRRGLSALQDNAGYVGLAHAARGRQRADWLIGMNLSRAYTLRAQRGGSRALLTVGRVQTPTLALVVARDRAIEGFTPHAYIVVEGRFEHAGGSFLATWKPKEDQAGLDAEGRLIDGAVAAALCAAVTGVAGVVTAFAAQPKKQPPPLCFSLADITVLASRKLGCTAEDALRTCQSLYETHKLTSYPRTDCGYLPRSQHADAPAVLAALRRVNPELAQVIDQANPQLKSPTYNDAKVTAHHGIVPTQLVGDKAALSPLERGVYELIVRRYLAQFWPDHESLQSSVTVEVAGEAFGATGSVVTREGWHAVDRALAQDEKDEGESDRASDRTSDRASDEKAQSLPRMTAGDPVSCSKAIGKNARTKPLPKFTEGSLIRGMEQIHATVTDAEQKKLLREGDGIGTSATRAAILGDLKRREFLVRQGKHVISTPLGRALIDALPESVSSPALTALYERLLKTVEQGEMPLDAFVQRQARFVTDRVAEAREGAVVLPSAALTPPVRSKSARKPRIRTRTSTRRTGATP